MGKKVKPIVAHPAQVMRSLEIIRDRKAYYTLITTLALIEDARQKKEISDTVAGLHALKCLTQEGRKDSFDWERFGSFVSSYEERLIPLPASLVFLIGDAFDRYLSEPEIDLATAFETKGAGSRRSARTTITDLTHSARLAAMINQERIAAKYPNFNNLDEGEDISLEEARERVLLKYADEPIELSDRTLQRAWSRWGALIEKITDAEILGPFKAPPDP